MCHCAWTDFEELSPIHGLLYDISYIVKERYTELRSRVHWYMELRKRQRRLKSCKVLRDLCVECHWRKGSLWMCKCGWREGEAWQIKMVLTFSVRVRIIGCRPANIFGGGGGEMWRQRQEKLKKMCEEWIMTWNCLIWSLNRQYLRMCGGN